MRTILWALKISFFVLKLPRFIARLFGGTKHAANSKQRIFFSPSSGSYIILALEKNYVEACHFFFNSNYYLAVASENFLKFF